MPAPSVSIFLSEAVIETLQSANAQHRRKRIHRNIQALHQGNTAQIDLKPYRSTGWLECDLSKGERVLVARDNHRGSIEYFLLRIHVHEDVSRYARACSPERCRKGLEGRIFLLPLECSRSLVDFEAWLKLYPSHLEFALSTEQLRAKEDIAYKDVTVLKGSAGTGKSVLLAHVAREVLQVHPDAQLLYITFSAALRDEARRLISSLGCEWQERCAFYTIDEFLGRVAGVDDVPFSIAEFYRWAQHTHLDSFSLHLSSIHSQVNGVLRGSYPVLSNDLRQGCMPLSDYLEDHRSHCVGSHAEEVHKVGLRYSRMLVDRERFDSQDLAALVACGPTIGAEAIRDWFPNGIAGIVADEVQDFTSLQYWAVDLLASELKARFIIAGDENQTIYPTSFQWSAVYDTCQTSLRLETNYRSAEPILRLGFDVLHTIKRELVKRDPNIKWKPKMVEAEEGREGPAVIRIRGTQKELDDLLAGLVASPRLVVLCRSEADLEFLRRLVDEANLALLDDFKGREQETVLLYRFFEGDRAFWNRALVPDSPGGPEIYHEVNRLYVGVSRAREVLAFLDENDDPTPWEFFKLGDSFHLPEPPWESFGASPPEGYSATEWRKLGEQDEGKGLYRKAMAAFRHAGDAHGVRRCEARKLQDEGEFAASGEIWFELRDYDHARSMFKQARRPFDCRRAEAEIALRDGDLAAAAEHLVFTRQWFRAGGVFEMLGREDDAREAFQKAGSTALLAFLARGATRVCAALEAELAKVATLGPV